MVLKRDISVIYGLPTELANLHNTDADLTNRLDIVQGDENTDGSIKKALADAIAYTDSNVKDLMDNHITPLENNMAIVQGDENTDGSIKKALADAEAYTDSNVKDLMDNHITPLENTVNILTGDANTEGSVDYKIAQVIGGAPEALDTLKEIADAINDDPNIAETLTNLMDSKIEDLKNQLLDGVSEQYDTLKELADAINLINADDQTQGSMQYYARLAKEAAIAYADENKLDKAQNLADLTDVQAARDNLDVYSKEEVDTAVINGGAAFITEELTVDSDKIVLSHKPKDGMIFNFNTVRNIDDNGVVTDIQVSPDSNDSSGKTYIVNGDYSGQFDGKKVIIQYPYTIDS